MSLNQVSVLSTFRSALLLFAAVAILSCPAKALSTASLPVQEGTEGADTLESLLGKWKDLESELIQLESDFKAAAEPTQQDELRTKYKGLVDQANEMVVQIKDKALESFKTDSSDADTSRLLVGILKNDAEFNRLDDAVILGDKLIDGGIDGTLFETAAKSDKISITTRELLEELFTRFNQQKTDTLPQVKIETSKGDIVIELFEDEAPNTVANFISLVEDQFYDGLKFHRVVEGFVAQGGDPNGDGSGGPGYSIACECYEVEARQHYIGSLSMAHAGKDTGGSQFFICLSRTPNLNELHTVFGRVVSGMEVLDRLSRNYTSVGPIPDSQTDEINKMVVLRKRDHEYKPIKIGEEKESDPPPVQPETMKTETTDAPNDESDESAADDKESESPNEESSNESADEESEQPKEEGASDSGGSAESSESKGETDAGGNENEGESGVEESSEEDDG